MVCVCCLQSFCPLLTVHSESKFWAPFPIWEILKLFMFFHLIEAIKQKFSVYTDCLLVINAKSEDFFQAPYPYI